MENWTKVKEERVYNGYRKIDRVTFKSPDGREDDYDIVSEGKVVCVLALTTDDQVVLAEQFRPGPDKVLLEMPGGGVNKNGEEPEAAARRELLEETGYTGDFEFVTTSFQSASSSMVRYNFVARNCHKIAETSNDEGEFTEPVLMSLEDFRKHIQSGELSDMGTGYRCLDYLGLL